MTQAAPAADGAPATRRREWIEPGFWIVLAGLGTLLGTGRWTVAVAAWIAPLAYLRLAALTSPARGFLVGMLVHGAAAAVATAGFFPVPWPLHCAIALLIGAASMQPVLLHRLLAPRLPGLPGTLVFPAAATALEALGQLAQPFGTWGAWGYTQVGFPPALQLAALGGLPALTFILAWSAATVERWLSRGRPSGARPGAALLGLVVAGAVLAGGALRLASAPPPRATVVAAAVDAPARIAAADLLAPLWRSGARFDFAPLLAQGATIRRELLARTEAAAAQGARLVAWPEASALLAEAELEPFAAALVELAQRRQITVVAAALVVLPPGQADGKRLLNLLLLVDAGGVRGRYLKAVPVPGIEAELTRAGDRPPVVVETSAGRLAAAICFDGDFPRLLAAAGAAGAALIVLPAEDYPAIDPTHGHMAALRAVENGAALLRPSRGGRSFAFDPFGRLLGARLLADAEAPTLLVHLPLLRRSTLGPRAGDLVAGAAGLLFLLLATLALRRHRPPGDPR